MKFPILSNAPSYTIDQVKKMMLELSTCPIKNSGTKVVMPTGDGTSGIMIIGEAPGAKEDLLGEPFVGASGNFLNTKLLPTVGLNRQNIYLTNIVKCRPPENRDPTEQEKEAWSEVLLAEIVAIKPKLVVCLGRHSMSFFNPSLTIGEVHGKIQKIKLYQNLEIFYLPMYHPAVALYNGSRAPILISDFRVVADFLNQNSQTPNFQLDNFNQPNSTSQTGINSELKKNNFKQPKAQQLQKQTIQEGLF
jgi:DNA polymerase